MAKIEVYSTENCIHCQRAKELLEKEGLPFDDIRVDEDPNKLKEMMELTQRRTVPQIIIDGNPIGGYDDLWALYQNGDLHKLTN